MAKDKRKSNRDIKYTHKRKGKITREQIENQIKRVRKTIARGLDKKSWTSDIADYREKAQNIRDYLTDLKKRLPNIDLEQHYSGSQRGDWTEASHIFYKLSNMENWMRMSTYKETLQRRVEGIVPYLENDEDSHFKVITNKQSRKATVITDKRTYEVTYKQISDFWRFFREHYDDISALKNYEKGTAGVSTAFNLYHGAGITDPQKFMDMIESRITLEKFSMLRQEEEDMADIYDKYGQFRPY